MPSHLTCDHPVLPWTIPAKRSRIKSWVSVSNKPISVTRVRVKVWVFRKRLRVKLYFRSDLDPESIASIHVSAVKISADLSIVFSSHQSQWRSLMVFDASLDGTSYPTFTSQQLSEVHTGFPHISCLLVLCKYLIYLNTFWLVVHSYVMPTKLNL